MLIILPILFPVCLVAQTLNVARLDSLITGDTLRVEQRGDTVVHYLFVRETIDSQLSSHLSDDELLLELVAKQSRMLHANDTLWEEYPHPL